MTQTTEIERKLRDALSDIYSPQSFDLWFNSPQSRLGLGRPTDLISEGRGDEVLQLAQEIRDGVYL